jgi:sulfite reductase (NADPH) flavoprotein alpha-component
MRARIRTRDGFAAQVGITHYLRRLQIAATTVGMSDGSTNTIATTAPPKWTRANPFPGKLKVNQRLSGSESEKDTRHFEIDLTGWGLSYEPGDSVAVYPTNDPQLVDETPKFLKAIAQRASSSTTALHELLAPERKQDLENYVWGMEVIDFLIDHKSVKFTPEEFVGLVTKLQPRLYSVGSSLRAFPDQVHFIIDVVRYESHGRVRKGVASAFLAERAENVPVPVYPSSAKHFHMPEDGNTPIIMIGPGTGVAPFRAFLQERQIAGAKGKNWLFFGAQREACDYAYKDEFARMKDDGVLTRIDCAFSRDQTHKIYVQHRMLENGAEIWKWIDSEGGQFFVCGDAKRMAKDVDAALRKIVQEHGGKSSDQANEYVEKLKSDKRYKRDVY